MHFFPHVLTGALLCNSLPHLAAGLRGEPFPTPFARPRGIGPSSPLVNFYWGALNLLLGVGLLAWSPLQVGLNVDSAALVLGALLLGTHLSRHFGRVRADRAARK